MFLLIINSLAYLLIFLYYQKKVASLQLGSVVLLLYVLSSVGSIYLYYVSPVWGIYDFQKLSFLPFLYLYVILIISFCPIMIFNNKKTENMNFPNPLIMNIISISIIFVHICFFFQTIYSSFSLADLFNADILSENYEDHGESMKTKNVINIFGVLKNIFADLLWIMLMYNWIFRKRLFTIGILISIIIASFTSLAWGARGPLVSIFLQIPFAFIVFRPLMSSSQRKIFLSVVGSFVGVLFVGFWAMTYGRFSDNVNHTITDILVYYFSSEFLFFNNYAMDPGGCRYGDRVFPLIRMLLGLDTAEGFKERRLMFPKLKIDDSQFSSFVGEFCIDFGPIVAFAIISFFSFIIYRKFKKKKYDFGDIVLGMLWYHILIFGFSLFVYAEKSGNMRILYLLFFSYLFKRITPRRRHLNQSVKI